MTNEEKARQIADAYAAEEARVLIYSDTMKMAQWKDSQIALKISKAYKEGFRSGFKAATLLSEDFKTRMEDEKD